MRLRKSGGTPRMPPQPCHFREFSPGSPGLCGTARVPRRARFSRGGMELPSTVNFNNRDSQTGVTSESVKRRQARRESSSS